METMTISQVAERAGIGLETVRFYEKQGLVPEPPRTRSGYRQFPDDTVARLRFIQRAKELGFSLREIQELIELRLDPSARSSDVKARAQAKIREIDGKIRDLQRMRTKLAELERACDGHVSTEDCPIIHALDHEYHT
jgi:Cu(I)-responsive transcriptional regulator